MKKETEYCIVMTTYDSQEIALKTINCVLEKKLAACVQTIDIGSHYSWNEKVCHEKEILVLMKTCWYLYDSLRDVIKENHSYETPEIIAVNIADGDDAYLSWMKSVTKA